MQRGLADYLETKRLAFPRFFFLSDSELLEVLSESREPARVQPFLRKIFEGINGARALPALRTRCPARGARACARLAALLSARAVRCVALPPHAALEFAPDGAAAAMLSAEGERVAFVRPFNPAAAGGAVERWLIECEAAMRETVRSLTRAALEDATARPRAEWLTRWPGQAVLAVDCVLWTADTAAAIRGGGPGLQRLAARLTSELLAVVERVRGPLGALERRVLSALIVLDVHGRDVVAELARAGVTSEADYAFTSQMRCVTCWSPAPRRA